MSAAVVERVPFDPAKSRCRRLVRTVRAAADWLEREADTVARLRGRRGCRKTFLTLTYREVRGWQPRHISEFLHCLRQWFKRHGERCRYVWVAELQRRGALHYHVVVFVPRHLRLPRPDACGWWPHGLSKVETARSPVGYLTKYATKTRPEDLARLPKGVRLHGNGGLGAFMRSFYRLELWPRWMRERADVEVRLLGSDEAEALGLSPGLSDIRKGPGGWWDRDTGALYRSPWRAVKLPGPGHCIVFERREAICAV